MPDDAPRAHPATGHHRRPAQACGDGGAGDGALPAPGGFRRHPADRRGDRRAADGQLAARGVLRPLPRDAGRRAGRRVRDRQAVAAVDQRRADGGVLPAGLAGDQAGGTQRPALHASAGDAAGDLRLRRRRRPGPDLRRLQSRRRGRDARLGDPDGDRHCVRARRAVAARVPRAAGHEGAAVDDRGGGRPDRDPDHRGVLFRTASRSARSRQRPSRWR